MILTSLRVPVAGFEAGTGWQIKPEGACKGEVCVPLRSPPQDDVDIETIASEMQLPLAAEPAASLWALGPESVSGHALTTAAAPDFELPDLDGNLVKLSDFKGKKILVYAWAPY